MFELLWLWQRKFCCMMLRIIHLVFWLIRIVQYNCCRIMGIFRTTGSTKKVVFMRLAASSTYRGFPSPSAGNIFSIPAQRSCVSTLTHYYKTFSHIRNQILPSISAFSRIIVAHYRLTRRNSTVACGFPKLITIKNNQAYPNTG